MDHLVGDLSSLSINDNKLLLHKQAKLVAKWYKRYRDEKKSKECYMPSTDEMIKVIVDRVRIDKENKQRVASAETLFDLCLMAKYYKLSAQQWGPMVEKHIMSSLKLKKPPNKTSGDGTRDGTNYEIKASLCDSDLNYVQIRPDHDIQWYILIAFFIQNNQVQLCQFKIPSEKVDELIITYGDYAHGTKKQKGSITADTIKGNGNEYALRPNPNGKPGTNKKKLWDEFVKYTAE